MRSTDCNHSDCLLNASKKAFCRIGRTLLYRINDSTGVCEHLVVGSERAALIDTGFGVGNLKGYVESLCSLPYAVYLTHGHLDHAGGAYGFPEVYMNSLDKDLERKQTTLEFRKQLMRGSGNVFDDDLYLSQRNEPFLELHDQDEIDLGGVHVLFLHVPGHTK